MRFSFLILFIFLIVFGLSASFSFAAGLQAIVTWEAKNYTPADFGGKAPATPNTPVSVSVQGVRNNKLVDLSGADFQWFLDESLVSQGNGLQEFVFRTKAAPPGEHLVRVSINSGGENVEATVRIPVIKPRVAIISPFRGKSVRGGGELTFEAVPYFFTTDVADNLSFFWNLNNIIKRSNVGRFFTLNPSGDRGDATLQVSVQNPNNLLELGKETLFFRVY